MGQKAGEKWAAAASLQPTFPESGRLLRRLLGWACALLWAHGAAAAMANTPAPASGNTCPPVAQKPTAEQAQIDRQSARDRGMLWRISKDGRDSYLYATIHVGQQTWLYPGPLLRQAWAKTDTLALELDPTDPALLKSLNSPASAASGGRAANMVLTPDLKARLKRQFELACVPQAALANMHPVMQATALVTLAGRWDGFDPGYAQEATLIGMARSQHSPRAVMALETPEIQLSALIPSSPGDLQKTMAQTLAQLEGPELRPMIRRLAQSWEKGDLGDLANYDKWCNCLHTDEDRAAFRKLNDGRNPLLADGIAKAHNAGQRVLAAVGALHMTGPQALPLLLAQRGFKVERIKPTDPPSTVQTEPASAVPGPSVAANR